MVVRSATICFTGTVHLIAGTPKVLRILPESLSGQVEVGLHGKQYRRHRQIPFNPAVLDHFLPAAHNVLVGRSWPASTCEASEHQAVLDDLTHSVTIASCLMVRGRAGRIGSGRGDCEKVAR